MRFAHPSRPHPLTPSPVGEGEFNFWLPSPLGRGAGGEGKTLAQKGFHVKLTPMNNVVPLRIIDVSQTLFELV
ncbi:hypothetical protein A6S26_34850 [Nostoc sp. ATCC 43529]|nr:hypothetical protein A6S26_34850 [Nostoc sp. ATCC 43529]